VPSYQFGVSVDQPGNALVLDGRGWGHGIGLSQYGALGKAMRGLKAADILATYYAGLRPVSRPATVLPARVRVAVDLGRQAATLSGTGVLRLSDGAGRTVALIGQEGWTVRGDGPGRLRLVPPPGQEGPPSVQAGTVHPTTVGPGGTARVRFTLSAPAAVSLTLTDGQGASLAAAAPAVVAAGPASGVVTAPWRPGAYGVTVVADAGPDRVASVPLTVRVAAPASTVSRRAPAGSHAGGGGRHASTGGPLRRLAALALATLVLVGAAGGAAAVTVGRVGRFRRRAALH